MKYSIVSLAFAFVAVLCPNCSHAALVDGLVARYDFNGNADDSSGFGNHGTVVGPTLSTNRFGAPNSAYLFDGVDDYIQLPESAAFDSTEFSISLWFRAASHPTQAGMLISKGQNNFEIHTGSELTGPEGMKFLPRFVAHGVPMDWHSPADSYSLGDWTHVVAVYNPGAEIRFYINGLEVPLVGPAVLYSAPDNLIDARLGTRTGEAVLVGTLPFHGDIDDVRIYDRVLTAGEVSELFSVPEPAGIVLAGVGLFVLATCRGSLRKGRARSASLKCPTPRSSSVSHARTA